MTTNDHDPDRRAFLARLGLASAAWTLLAGCATHHGRRRRAAIEPALAPPAATTPTSQPAGEEDVTPAEDLMREHGVLNRVLLVYDACVARIEAKQDLPPEPLADAAKLIKVFVEDYHERIEEEHLFPRFRAKGKLVDLVDVLAAQHKAGRDTTARIQQLATFQGLRDPAQSRELIARLREFIRMYRPHEAREDTILFPALHEVVTKTEYDAMGDEFEKIEKQQLGDEGFEHAVEHVAEIEKKLGLYDLAQFTPRG
jgi:hemerythrin-like domain-containing protein